MCVYPEGWFPSAIRLGRVPALKSATPAALQPSPAAADHHHGQFAAVLSFRQRWIVEFRLCVCVLLARLIYASCPARIWEWSDPWEWSHCTV